VTDPTVPPDDSEQTPAAGGGGEEPITPEELAMGRGRVEPVGIEIEMQHSYLDYAMSVIVSRALPDVRDGLKPVHRKILWGMFDGGYLPDRGYVKCARVVGDVMSNYHPHGDLAIYDSLVRMGQPWSLRYPLVDGNGNFGSPGNDRQAAMRYTECRLAALTMGMLQDIREGTVDFNPNYDGRSEEPDVLPARFPNLLVNGASGIAVGMATSIPPHNLGEVIDACLMLIRKPDATVDQLMRKVPGPDFPTGARIVDSTGIRDAYLTGRGSITMEAVAATETRSGGLPRIVVTEIPYLVNKAALLEKIADLVKERRLAGVRDLRDESSRDGMRIVIELKRGEDPAKTLARLYKLTDLRTNFNVNFVALAAGGDGEALQPRTLGLKEALEHYLAHQRIVLTRRTTHRRAKAAERAHILEGLLVALDHLDEVIALIRGSDTPDEARAELVSRYELTEPQATAILDMQLRRLAALERQRIADEHRDLLARIAELDEILADPAKLDALLADELKELKARHGSPRRSRLTVPAATDDDEEPADTAAPVLEAQAVTVYVTRGGYLKPVPERRIPAAHNAPRDPLAAVVRATTDDTLLLVDADGDGWRIPLADVPVTTMRQRGTTVAQLLGDGPDAPIVGAVRLDDVETVLTVSANGLVKRTERAEYEGRTRAMIAAGLRDGDRIVGASACNEGDHVLLAHSGGLVTRFAASDVRPMGRGAAGVAGMKVPEGAEVVAVSVAPGGADERHEVVILAADGSAKRTPLAEFPVKGRGGKGVQAGAAELAWCGLADSLQAPTADGVVVLRGVEAAAARRTGRCTAAVAAVTGRVAAVPPNGA
jgi:DNA gyrase subunit A